MKWQEALQEARSILTDLANKHNPAGVRVVLRALIRECERRLEAAAPAPDSFHAANLEQKMPERGNVIAADQDSLATMASMPSTEPRPADTTLSSPEPPTPAQIARRQGAVKGGSAITPAKLAALAELRRRRKQARWPIVPPEGWPSVEALLANTKDFCLRHHLTTELADYIGVEKTSVRRWLAGQKIPRQQTVDKIGAWRRIKSAECPRP